MTTIADEARSILLDLGVAEDRFAGGSLAVRSPITGESIGAVAEIPAAADAPPTSATSAGLIEVALGG